MADAPSGSALGPPVFASADELGLLPGRHVPLLFLNVFVIAICGLVYELLAGSVASYLLGDSITQFSLVIGLYLSGMGVGSYLSRFVSAGVGRCFIEVQLAIALVGGSSAPLLFAVYGLSPSFKAVLWLEVALIGVLVGLELPLLMRILERELAFKELVSRVLAVDYIGALVASLLFPLVFVPRFGLVRTALVMGLLNAAVGAWATQLLAHLLTPRLSHALRLRALLIAAALVVGLIKADTLSSLAEERAFAEPVVYSETTPYQRIVVTQAARGFQLWLNGNLQFDSADEYRYHEALVHPAFAAVARPVARVLVLGGGDGLALREILRHPSVSHVTLVDLDPGMTSLSRSFPKLAALNQHAFDDPRVQVENADAFVWVAEREKAATTFDAIVVDFPDPNHFALGKLYTRRFYALLKTLLADDGAMVVQSTSPLLVPRSFWTIVTTLEAADLDVAPYHVHVPSFGEWGYCLVRKQAGPLPEHAPIVNGIRFLNDAALASMFVLPMDMARTPAEVNRLDNQALVHVYESEGARWR
jgi:spermidine synthase